MHTRRHDRPAPFAWVLVGVFAAAGLFASCGGSAGTPPTPPSSNAALRELAPSSGTLSPPFDSEVLDYVLGPSIGLASVAFTPAAADAGATIEVNGWYTPSGSPSPPIPLDPGSNPVTVTVTAADGRTTSIYTVLCLRALGGQDTYLKAFNTGAGAWFGSAVAISGDTLVVGAQGESSDAIGAGAAYVFVREGSTWTQQATLRASNAGAGDFFGASVAISADTLVVGAYLEASAATGVGGDETDDTAPDAGAAYIFVREGSTWTQQAYLKASNAAAGDFFGISVALSGDTLVVGAPGESSDASGAGAAYVFVREGSTWIQQAYLKASSTASLDWFGSAVAISGDTLVVGAQGESSDAIGAGAAYVFVREGSTWTQQATLRASNAGGGDFFGASIAISADTLVVCALWEASAATGVGGDETDDTALLAGAAYVFVREGSTWTQQAYVKASNTGAGDWFGSSVALSGDVLVVAAPWEASAATGVGGDETDDTAPQAGAAYVFVREGSTWTQQAYLKASNAAAGDFFGISVALSGDTLVVGAGGEASAATNVDGDQTDDAAPDAGAVYVFR